MEPKLKIGSRPPWVGLGVAVWVEIAAGNAYTFPLYSSSLKSVLGFSQQQLTMLGVANDIGENLGILPGLACNKFPPWIVLFVGALCSFLGYGVLWLAVSQTVSNLPYWLLWIALGIAANSSAWFGTGVLVTNMRNFPLSRGTIAGILKGYIGLSTLVYTELYTFVLNQSDSNLLLFLTLGLPFICISLMFFIRPCVAASGEDSSVHVHFLFTQAASVFLAVFLLSTTILSDILTLSTALCYSFLVLMVIFLMSPLAIPLKMTLSRSKPKNTFQPGHSSGPSDLEEKLNEEENKEEETQLDHVAPLLTTQHSSGNWFGILFDGEYGSDVELLLAEGEGAIIEKKRRPKRGEDFSFREACVKADFWLLWVVYFCGIGSGVTVLNNLSQIGVALGDDDTTILLALFGFGNFLGRLGGGAVSEYFVRKKALPRPVWMTCTQPIMIISFLLYTSALAGTLYIATALLGIFFFFGLGICYGVQLSIMVPTSSELFGLKHFGVIFNVMQLGNPIGALLFSGLLAGYVYDAEATKQQSSTCLGAECFKLTFYVLAGVCGIGTMLSVILVHRIKPVYKMLYAGGSYSLPQGSNI